MCLKLYLIQANAVFRKSLCQDLGESKRWRRSRLTFTIRTLLCRDFAVFQRARCLTRWSVETLVVDWMCSRANSVVFRRHTNQPPSLFHFIGATEAMAVAWLTLPWLQVTSWLWLASRLVAWRQVEWNCVSSVFAGHEVTTLGDARALAAAMDSLTMFPLVGPHLTYVETMPSGVVTTSTNPRVYCSIRDLLRYLKTIDENRAGMYTLCTDIYSDTIQSFIVIFGAVKLCKTYAAGSWQ